MARRRAGGRRWEPAEPAPEEMLGRLRLTTGRAAQLCGVTRRQLCYWTDQGIIQAVASGEQDEGEEGDGGQRAYDCAALRKVLLIKESLARGGGVRRAAQEAEDWLRENRRRAEGLKGASPEERQPFLVQQAERLDRMAERMQHLATARDRHRMIGISSQLEALGEACSRVLCSGRAMHEDADGCLAVATRLERLEEALAESEDSER